MPSFREVELSTSSDAGRRLVINLASSQSKTVRVRSCEVLSRGLRNRTSFQTPLSIEQVFTHQFAAVIEDLLGRLSGEKQVISLPSYNMELGGALLSGVQVVATRDEKDGQHILLRFMMFLGTLDSIMTIPLRVSDGARSQTAHIAQGMLADIALPLLNFCTAITTSKLSDQSSMMATAAKLRQEMPELVFQIELLKRFCTQIDEGEPAPPPPIRALDPVHEDNAMPTLYQMSH